MEVVEHHNGVQILQLPRGEGVAKQEGNNVVIKENLVFKDSNVVVNIVDVDQKEPESQSIELASVPDSSHQKEPELKPEFEAAVIDAKMFADLKEKCNCDCVGDCFRSMKEAISSCSCSLKCCSCSSCSVPSCMSCEIFGNVGKLEFPPFCEPLTNAVSAVYRYINIFIVGTVLHVQKMIFGWGFEFPEIWFASVEKQIVFLSVLQMICYTGIGIFHRMKNDWIWEVNHLVLVLFSCLCFTVFGLVIPINKNRVLEKFANMGFYNMINVGMDTLHVIAFWLLMSESDMSIFFDGMKFILLVTAMCCHLFRFTYTTPYNDSYCKDRQTQYEKRLSYMTSTIIMAGMLAIVREDVKEELKWNVVVLVALMHFQFTLWGSAYEFVTVWSFCDAFAFMVLYMLIVAAAISYSADDLEIHESFFSIDFIARLLLFGWIIFGNYVAYQRELRYDSENQRYDSRETPRVLVSVGEEGTFSYNHPMTSLIYIILYPFYWMVRCIPTALMMLGRIILDFIFETISMIFATFIPTSLQEQDCVCCVYTFVKRKIDWFRLEGEDRYDPQQPDTRANVLKRYKNFNEGVRRRNQSVFAFALLACVIQISAASPFGDSAATKAARVCLTAVIQISCILIFHWRSNLMVMHQHRLSYMNVDEDQQHNRFCFILNAMQMRSVGELCLGICTCFLVTCLPRTLSLYSIIACTLINVIFLIYSLAPLQIQIAMSKNTEKYFFPTWAWQAGDVLCVNALNVFASLQTDISDGDLKVLAIMSGLVLFFQWLASLLLVDFRHSLETGCGERCTLKILGFWSVIVQIPTIVCARLILPHYPHVWQLAYVKMYLFLRAGTLGYWFFRNGCTDPQSNDDEEGSVQI